MDIQNKPDISRVVSDELFRAGISPHFVGFNPLAVAVQISVTDGTHKRKLTGEVYPQIAQLFGVSPNAVERNIRTAIARAWTSGTLPTYFRGKGVTIGHRPSNAEFIALMAYVVTSNM